MKLPPFFSSKPSAPETAAELAVKVAEAEQAHRAALEVVEAARSTFAAERTEAAQAVHKKARDAAADLADMLSILRDEHAAAGAKEAAEERARLEAKLRALTEKTSRASILAAGREQAELEARLLIQVAQCRIRRRELRDWFRQQESERFRVALALDPKAKSPGTNSEADAAIATEPVVEILRAEATDGLLAGLLKDLKPTNRSYFPSMTRFDG